MTRSEYTINGVGEIAILLAEVANPALELPNQMQQYIFQVFRVLTHDIALLNLEWDKELVMSRYAAVRAGLLELQQSVIELFEDTNLVRRQVLEWIQKELEEMLSLLELTREICLK